MTVTTDPPILKIIYTGDGLTGSLAVTFPYTATSDVVVTQRLISDGTEVTMVEGTNYTLTPSSGATGTITILDAGTDFTSSYQWVVTRDVPQTQSLDLVENDAFPSGSVESAFDRSVLLTQDLQEQANRSLHYPLSDSNTLSAELPNSTTRLNSGAGSYLGFDASGEPVCLDAPTDTSITTTFSQTLLDDASASDALGTLGFSTYGKTLIDDANAAAALTTLNITRGTAASLPASSAEGALYISNDTDQIWYDDGASMNELQPGDGKNLIINGCCRVWQRGTPLISTSTFPNSDDSYVADHVILLSEAATDVVDVSQETSDVPTGSYSAIKLDVETANNQFGLLFPIEARDAATIIDGVASLSFKAKIAVNPSTRNLRAAILSWDSTADSITSDVVGTWNAEGAEHTWAANWTREGADPTATDFTLTTSWQTFKVENVSIDTTSTANVAVFIWCDEDDMAIGEFVYIADVKLEKGSHATTFHARPFEEEMRLCERYFQKSFQYATAPVQDVGNFLGAALVRTFSTASGSDKLDFRVRMLKTATVVTYNPSAAAATFSNLAETTNLAVTISQESETGFVMEGAGGASEAYLGHWTAVAEL